MSAGFTGLHPCQPSTVLLHGKRSRQFLNEWVNLTFFGLIFFTCEMR